jgi:hypothetical protein
VTGGRLGGFIDRIVGTVDIPFLLVNVGLVGSELLVVAVLLVFRMVLAIPTPPVSSPPPLVPLSLVLSLALLFLLFLSLVVLSLSV